MRPLLFVVLASLLCGCGRGEAEKKTARPDPKDQALARRHKSVSKEFIEKLVAGLERKYPPTGHDIWTLVDSVAAHPDTSSEELFEQRLTQVVLKALRVRAENIFAVVCVGRDPPGTDDLKFVLINRTGRKVAAVSGVIRILHASFDTSVASLNLSMRQAMDPGGQAAYRGHWSMPPALVEQVASQDKRYKLKFVAAKVTYADSKVEQFP